MNLQSGFECKRRIAQDADQRACVWHLRSSALAAVWVRFVRCIGFSAGLLALAASARADCTLTNVGLTALPDLGWRSYSNFNRYFVGGLYPNGANQRPAEHEAAGLRIASEEIRLLDTNGVPASNGAIVLISSGMSNTTQEWAPKGTNHFTGQANRDPSKNPRVTIIDGAIGGQDATTWTNLNSPNWTTVISRIQAANRSTNQVQVLWLKQAIKDESGALTNHAVQLEGYLEQIVRNAKTLFPNLKICYVSSRTRAYVYDVDGTELNPEPIAYESGFAVKWLIEKQINGAPELNYDAARGPVRAPWLSWGPFLWTDGTRGRSDPLLSICPDDLESDFTHPSATGGVPKVARELLAFFKTDATATAWFLHTNSPLRLPPTCAPTADVTTGVVPLTVNFSANASAGSAPIRDYQWTFGDGLFATSANPQKSFHAPGTYHARVTVTDTNGSTATGVVTIHAQVTFDLWRAVHFSAAELSDTNISGATADPDHDGIENRLEYALGLNPNIPNTPTNGLPRASLDGGVFSFTYSRLKAASDLSLTVQTSADLKTWTTAAPSRVVDNGLYEIITIDRNLSSSQAAFFKFDIQ